MRRMIVWTAVAASAFAGTVVAQTGAPTQRQAGTQQQARVHKPADGQGLGKDQAKIAKKQRKQADKAARKAAKAERKANKTTMAGAKKGAGNGPGYRSNSGRRSGPMDGTRPQKWAADRLGAKPAVEADSSSRGGG